MPDAGLGNLQVLLKIQAEHFERDAEVQARVGVRDQIDHEVGLLDERVDVPFRAPYVLLHEREAWMIEQLPDLVRPQVNGGDGVALG